MQRRDFLGVAMAAALGSNLIPEIAHLDSWLPERIHPLRERSRIGLADVEAIEAAADHYRRKDLEHGSASYCDAALIQLRRVASYRHAEVDERLRPRLWTATADLAWVAGWLAYDLEDHDSARRVWSYGLWSAGQGAEDPRSTDVAVGILLDLTHQALHLWRPLWIPPTAGERAGQRQVLEDATRFAQTAAAVGGSRRHPASTVAEAYTASVTGWCWAARGDTAAMDRSLRHAEDLYAMVDHADLPPWAASFTPAEISAQRGHSYYLLSIHDRGHAAAAVELLGSAVEQHAAAHARSRAVVLPTLAGACLQAGDHDAAARHSEIAIAQIEGLTSQRCYTRLADLGRIAAQYEHRDSAVGDMRARISDVVAGTV